MRRIAHISDLHFGRLNAATLPALAAAIGDSAPDLLVVSGDLTQRARTHQFAAAKRFLDTLAVPKLIVPGNHDVPLYNIATRWMRPLAKYRKHIGTDLEPFYEDEEIAVLGINTAHGFTIAGGRVGRDQVERAAARFAAGSRDVTRIIVTHHPFDLPADETPGKLVLRADMAMAAFAHSRIDLILSGHLHLSRATESVVRYGPGRSALLVQAGTATSSRVRGEGNAFNLLRIGRGEIDIDILAWDEDRQHFAVAASDRFDRSEAGWSRRHPPDRAP